MFVTGATVEVVYTLEYEGPNLDPVPGSCVYCGAY